MSPHGRDCSGVPVAMIWLPRSPPSTEVDDPVGALYDIEVVLDDEHGVARGDQAIEHQQQALDVVKVQARSRLSRR